MVLTNKVAHAITRASCYFANRLFGWADLSPEIQDVMNDLQVQRKLYNYFFKKIIIMKKYMLFKWKNTMILQKGLTLSKHFEH